MIAHGDGKGRPMEAAIPKVRHGRRERQPPRQGNSENAVFAGAMAWGPSSAKASRMAAREPDREWTSRSMVFRSATSACGAAQSGWRLRARRCRGDHGGGSRCRGARRTRASRSPGPPRARGRPVTAQETAQLVLPAHSRVRSMRQTRARPASSGEARPRATAQDPPGVELAKIERRLSLRE